MIKTDRNFILLGIVLIVLMLIGKKVNGQDTTGVRQMIVAYDIKHPDIVMRQLCLESGYLNCKDCSWACCNNPFGMYYKGAYLKYDNLEDAIESYKRWQTYHYKGGDYYAFLERVGYATEPTYVERLKRMW